MDDHGHGTHVAGTAAGNVYGVAKEAYVIGVKVLDSNNRGSWAGVISGLNFTGNRASRSDTRLGVVNMSLGGGRSATVDAAVQSLLDMNIPVVVSAGNDYHADACNKSPAGLGGVGGDVITVMASDINDAFAGFSNCGDCTDVIGPGVNIKSAGHTGTSAYTTKSGTSMATPAVAGLVARYLAQNPGMTPAALKAWIVGQAEPGLVPIPADCPHPTPDLLAQSGCYI